MIIINYLLILILGGGWAVSVINFHPGREVHILLILAMVTMSGVISKRDSSPKRKILEIDQA